jgi:hypothetical protein
MQAVETTCTLHSFEEVMCFMSIFTAKGAAAAESAAIKPTIKMEDVLIKLKKDGDSVRVRILGKYDYAEYKNHGVFKRLFSRPCLRPAGLSCPDCELVESGLLEEDEKIALRAKPKYLMAFGVLETGQIGIFDASRKQFQALKPTIDKYSEPDEEGEIGINVYAFDLVQRGQDTSKTVALELVPKMTKAEKEAFAKFDGVTVEDDLFERVLRPRDRATMIDDLAKAGFDTSIFGGSQAAEADVKPVSDDPTEQF